MRQAAGLRQPPPSRRWPLAGMFAVGLVAGAIGSYAFTQRSRIESLAARAFDGRQQAVEESGELEVGNPISITSHRSNHRRRADSEVIRS